MEMIEVKSEPRNEKTTSYRFRTILKLPSYVVLRSTPLYFDSFRNETQAPPRLLVSRVHAASTIFSSILRQKPEEKASGCTAAKWKDNFAEPGQTFDGFEHPAPRFPFPRFITSNFVSSFVSTLVSHLRFSPFLSTPPSLFPPSK